MSSKVIDDGGPAFPCPAFHGDPEGSWPKGFGGMTMRDYFAGQALAGMNAYSGRMEDEYGCEVRAVSAYAQADAMLRARGQVS